MKKVSARFIIILILTFTISCLGQSSENEVVVYTSVDQVYSSKILRQFEKETGIAVKTVFDAEASKAVGLEQRIIAEKNSPKADIFWNSEFMRTARLARSGLFEKYNASTDTYPDSAYFSPRKSWYGMGVRTRVFIVNTEMLSPEEYPTKLTDLCKSKFKGKAAISTPFSGSTSTHFAALYTRLGEDRFVQFLKLLKENEVSFLAGNSVVKDAVGHGRFALGLVDTDDALVGIEQGLPIKMVYYDQDDLGVFSIFQTVALLRNAPNPSNASRLIDYLLTQRTENELISMNAVQFPILSGDASGEMPKIWTASADEVVDSLDSSVELIRTYIDY